MPQKILAGRAADPQLRGDLVQVKVDQVVLSRAPNRAFAEALAAGVKKTPVEVAIAYDGTCVTDAPWDRAAQSGSPLAVSHEMLSTGMLVARPGIGYPAPVHLERFGSPARLALTDDPRLAPLGGVGMLVLVVSPGQLGQALAQGTVWLRPPRSVQILLSGRTRPFVCARDVALELIRRGIADTVRRIEAQHKAPVVLEFAGTSAKLLNVSERAVLAAIAPLVGAQAGLFLSDEKTESFLRDQRRSKAHRTLFADQGAPCDDAISLDLATVDPLLIDETGQIRPVRDLAGKPVTQAILGGDSGVTLRDMMAAAALLKSKRVPPRLDFLVAPPSRQVFEVMAQSGALADLAATGARIIEPDRRVMLGEMYPPPPGKLSVRTCDPEPLAPGFVVASAETLAYTVATGAVGDPRAFKRPVRVTVPRTLPTDDVLVLRERRAEASTAKRTPPTASVPFPWKGPTSIELGPFPGEAPKDLKVDAIRGVVAANLDAVRAFVNRLFEGQLQARVLIASYLPAGVVNVLAGFGVVAFSAAEADLPSLLAARTIALPAPQQWNDPFQVATGKTKVTLACPAVGVERAWLTAGSSRAAPAVKGRLASSRGQRPLTRPEGLRLALIG